MSYFALICLNGRDDNCLGGTYPTNGQTAALALGCCYCSCRIVLALENKPPATEPVGDEAFTIRVAYKMKNRLLFALPTSIPVY
jgi:hypothetical protein